MGDSTAEATDSTAAPPCELIEGQPVDWSGRGTSHVEYNKNDVLPLTRGRFLGYGVNGGVYETTCNGVKLAWKQKFSRRKIGDRERREIEIIKKLNHEHIIRLIGTYTHDRFMGLLLWPVAVCDLANLLEDFEWLSSRLRLGKDKFTENEEAQTRLEALKTWHYELHHGVFRTMEYLQCTIGCIASAVEYLHDSNIKHKDLKPSNILLSATGLWITDFGTATDFSILSSSETENGERGTPKYFAPEVAAYGPSGRSADIFSMGCIFFEIMTLTMGFPLRDTKKLRDGNDHSFHSNIARIRDWIVLNGSNDVKSSNGYVLDLVRTMMEIDPEARPTAAIVRDRIELINGLTTLLKTSSLFLALLPCCGKCCNSMDGQTSLVEEKLLEKDSIWLSDKITVEITFLLNPSNDGMGESYTAVWEIHPPRIVEQIHIFLHRAAPSNYLLSQELSSAYDVRGPVPAQVCMYVELFDGFYWSHPHAKCVPGGDTNRMLPILWKGDDLQPSKKSTKIFTAKVFPIRSGYRIANG